MDYLSRIDRDRATSIIGVAAAVSLIYNTVSYASKRNKTPNGYKEIPVPGSSYPYIGHLLSIGKNPTTIFRKWHNEFGSIIKLNMGVQTWISISDPYMAHELFSTKGKDSSQRPLTNFGFHYSYNASGVVFGNGDRWKKCRAAMISVLSPKMVDRYMEKIEFEALDLVERLLKNTEKDGGVNPITDLQINSLNIISHVTVGKRYESKNDPEFQAVAKMIKNMIKLCAFEIDLPRFLPVLSLLSYVVDFEKRFKDYVKYERDPVVKKLMEEATASSDINVMKFFEAEAMNITPAEKLVTLTDMLVGGEDTTRATLCWAIAILCHHPDVQKKMQAEIDDFIKNHGKRPSFSQRNDIPFTVSVMRECMRYRPSTTFGLAHETTKDIVLNQYIIPKGATVVAPMRLLHENSNVYDSPEKFIPERFLNNTDTMFGSANGKVADRDHFNFGWGRRICPGIYLAEAVIFNSYISLFSKCTIEPITDVHNNPMYPDIENEQNAGVVVIPADFSVRIVERSLD